MSKGYMIFVEGGNTPVVVHETFQEACAVASKMGNKHRGKEVYVLQIHKRFIKPIKAKEESEMEKLQAHLPEKVGLIDGKKPRLTLKDMVYKEEITTTEKEEQNNTPKPIPERPRITLNRGVKNV